jgi:phage shock protein A
MWKVIKRRWKYLAMKLHVLHEETADPKVQLEQSIQEARAQHRRLTEQAANVIANQKQAQARLDNAVSKHDRANASAGQALLLADRESRGGDPERAAKLTEAAESLAGDVIVAEREIGGLQQQLLQAARAAENAKAAVAQNGDGLQHKLAEKEQLLDTLARAQMQEQMNAAMAQLSATIGEDVPTFAEVTNKINGRLWNAEAAAELLGAQATSSSQDVLLEIERAQRQSLAQARISEMRAALGLSPAPLEAIEAASRDAREASE